MLEHTKTVRQAFKTVRTELPPNDSRLPVALAAALVLGTLGVSLVLYRRIAVDQLYFSRAVVVLVAAELAAVAILLRDRMVRIVREFFNATSAPVSLAVFRVVVFWRIYREVEFASILPYARMPAGMLVPPWGTAHLLRFFSLNENVVRVCVTAVLIFSIMGMLGLFSRFSALACAVLGFYVLGIPELSGKIDHYHHLIWFPALLALSPCGDFLAIDAILAARKRADAGDTDPPPPSTLYALPLRIAMILLGLIYFFPGLWKLWESGFAWLEPSHLKSLLHAFWTWSYDMAWLPAFRIDQHPWLCGIGAAATVIFEITFIFLMFSPKSRVVAAGGGVLFHNTTNAAMGISFFSLQESYAALLDWDTISRWIGRRVFAEEMLFGYNGGCSTCRRRVASLRVFDILRRVTYIDGWERVPGTSLKLDVVNLTDESSSHVIAIAPKRRWTGFRAYRALLRRIPVFWPLLPLCYLPGLVTLVDRAHSQGCRIRQLSTPTPEFRTRRMPQLAAIAGFGAMLAVMICICGFGKITTGWPIACYPTFSSPPQPELTTARLYASMPDGHAVRVRFKGIAHHRLYWMLLHALPDAAGSIDRQRLDAFWKLAVRNDPTLASASAVVFYKDVLWTDPELWQSNPRDRQAFYRLQIAPCGNVPSAAISVPCGQLPPIVSSRLAAGETRKP